jgi:hypothetical protein
VLLAALCGGCASMFTFTEASAANDLRLEASAYRLAAESVVNARNLRQITADNVKAIVPVLRTWSETYHKRAALLTRILDLPAASPQRETLIWQWRNMAPQLAAVQAELARQMTAATATAADPDASLLELLPGPTTAPAAPAAGPVGASQPAGPLSVLPPRATIVEREFD